MKKYVALRIRRPMDEVPSCLDESYGKWQLLGQRKKDLNWENIGSFSSKKNAVAFGILFRGEKNWPIYDEHGYGIKEDWASC